MHRGQRGCLCPASYILYLKTDISSKKHGFRIRTFSAQLKAAANFSLFTVHFYLKSHSLQKGGVPAAPSGTATLLRLSPNHRFHPRPTLAVTDFRRPRLSWLDGRCVQGPGTYSPRHG